MQFVQMAATTSTHRCVLKSLRLLYHRSCREQSDPMLTVGITFVFLPYIPARGKRQQSVGLRTVFSNTAEGGRGQYLASNKTTEKSVAFTSFVSIFFCQAYLPARTNQCPNMINIINRPESTAQLLNL